MTVVAVRLQGIILRPKDHQEKIYWNFHRQKKKKKNHNDKKEIFSGELK